MILHIHATVRTRLRSVLAELYGLSPDTMPAVVIQYPPNRTLGDLAITVAFELARTLRKAPRVIAQEIVDALGELDGIAKAEATASGYVNIYIDRPRYLRDAIRGAGDAPPEQGLGKTIVEHTAINPNKAAHIGHLRNAALGDTLVRVLRFHRQPVEVQNYIDDTGVQVADVVVGFRELRSKSLADVKQLADTTRFDDHCWDLYAEVTQWYEQDDTRLEHRRQTLRDLEHGGNSSAEMAGFIADRIVRCHLATMERLNVEYDLLSWEGDILRLDFWTTAFEILKEAGVVFLQDHGKQAGCWVMRIDESQDRDGQEEQQEKDEPDVLDTAEDQRSKVIVRSDGTVTYVGKDIAYQLWKFGLLGRDFRYRPYSTQRSGNALWATTHVLPDARGSASPPSFGHGAAVYNVIDTRQAYLQQLLRQALSALGHVKEAERSVHFSYEMVALSHSTAQALGHDTTDSVDRPFVEVSGRKGLGVKADDLLDRLTQAAAKEVRARNEGFSDAEVERTASMIAVCAVRYFMIKYSRGKVIVFDIDEALTFEGESGPYLQYAAVRAGNILEKLRTQTGTDAQAIAAEVITLDPASLDDPVGTDLWALVLDASRLNEITDQAVRTLELSTLAKYAFGLAQTFNTFYHSHPVISEPDVSTRLWRAAAVSYFRTQITRALDLMGCDVPKRM